MDLKETVEEKKAILLEKTKGLLETSRRKMDDIDLRPLWVKMRKGVDRAVEAVGKGTEKAAEKAASFASRASLQYQTYEYYRNREKLLIRLGERIYDLSKRNPQALGPNDHEIIEITSQIADLDKKISSLDQKIKFL